MREVLSVLGQGLKVVNPRWMYPQVINNYYDQHVVQETPSNPSLDELHAQDAAHDILKDEEAGDGMADAKKVS